jgi:hypothetical protein
MTPLEELDALLSAEINPNLWSDDPYYSDRAASLGSSLSAADWSVLLDRRALRTLSWMEKAVEALGDSGVEAALPLLEAFAQDEEPSVAEIAQFALEERRR